MSIGLRRKKLMSARYLPEPYFFVEQFSKAFSPGL